MQHVLIKGNSLKSISESLYNTVSGLGLQSFKKIVLDLSSNALLLKSLDNYGELKSGSTVVKSTATDKLSIKEGIKWIVEEINKCEDTCYIIINSVELLHQCDLDYLIDSASKSMVCTMFIFSQLLDENKIKANKSSEAIIDTFEIQGIFTVERKYGILMSIPA